jgi:hypothetical protein
MNLHQTTSTNHFQPPTLIQQPSSPSSLQHPKWLPFKLSSLWPWPWLSQLPQPSRGAEASTQISASSALMTPHATPVSNLHRRSPSSIPLSPLARTTLQMFATPTRRGAPSTLITFKLDALVSNTSPSVHLRSENTTSGYGTNPALQWWNPMTLLVLLWFGLPQQSVACRVSDLTLTSWSSAKCFLHLYQDAI